MDKSAISAIVKTIEAAETAAQNLHKIARALVKRGSTIDRVRDKETECKLAIKDVLPKDKETTRRATAYWRRFFGAFVASLPEDQQIEFKTTLVREKEERALQRAKSGSGTKRARDDDEEITESEAPETAKARVEEVDGTDGVDQTDIAKSSASASAADTSARAPTPAPAPTLSSIKEKKAEARIRKLQEAIVQRDAYIAQLEARLEGLGEKSNNEDADAESESTDS